MALWTSLGRLGNTFWQHSRIDLSKRSFRLEFQQFFSIFSIAARIDFWFVSFCPVLSFWQVCNRFFGTRLLLCSKQANHARHRFFCAWPVFCKCFAKSLIAARSPKSTSGAIEKLWRRRPKKFEKSMKKPLQKRLAARSHRSSKKRAETDGNGGPETLKSELGRPTASGKARPSTSGAFKK